MPIGSNPVQISNPGDAVFTVDSITDPNGKPANVMDVDQGFTVTGSVSMPKFLTADSTVCLYADELGSTFDAKVACTTVKFPVTGPPEDVPNVVNWTINYPADASTTLPDPSSGSQLYRLAAVFMYGDQSFDIASFVELGTFLIN